MAERLKKSILYTYGVGDLFFAAMVSMESYFFAAFLTDYAQFSLVVAGQILGITSFIDILCALAGGVLLQKVTLKRGGKYRSWLLLGPPIVAPLFALQFTKIGSPLTAAALIMFGFVTSHLLFNVVWAATAAMTGRLSQLPDERTILSVSRAQGMAAASLLFSITSMPMITFFGTRSDRITGFTLTAAVYTLLMILGYLYVYRITAGKDPYDEEVAGSSRKQAGQSMGQMVKLVLVNPPLLTLLLSTTFTSTGLFLITAFAFYYMAYVLNDAAFLSVFMLSVSIARILGTIVAPWIGVKIGKRYCYCVFLAVSAVGFASARFMNETPWTFTLTFCASVVFGSISSSMNTALFSDTVVYGEWKTGSNIRAFTMAMMNVPIKLGVLIRSAIVTAGLIAIGFVANTAATPRVIDGISSMMTFGPAATYGIAAAIFYVGYRLDEKQVVQMQEEIEARKTGEVKQDFAAAAS